MLNAELSTQTKDTQEVLQLIQLSPEEITEDWEAVSEGVLNSAPPTTEITEKFKDNLYKQLLNGNLTCYGLYESGNPILLITFQLTGDIVATSLNLMIYSIYAYRNITMQEWHYLLNVVKKIAKERNCSKIVAFTNVERVINIVNILGGNTETRLIQLEVL